MKAPSLATYRARRRFDRTPEPEVGVPAARADAPVFVIQKHDATRLHYDFRLELDGVLLSWAVPKGPSLDPADRRLAVRTEDHPLAYAAFEGTIPAGEYGGGSVLAWDRGTWAPAGDARAGLEAGKLVFDLHGHKLHGRWELLRTQPGGGTGRARQEQWLLFKKRDAHARPRAEFDITAARPGSIGAAMPAPPAAEAAPSLDDAAPAAPLPETLAPQLAVLATAVPEGRWIFEAKFDGYRIVARVDGPNTDDVRLLTRNGNDWTAKLPRLAQALAALGVRGAWFDGEAVVAGANGRDDFNALQNAFDGRDTAAVEYALFDLPFFEGRDLRRAPLVARRELLQRLLQERPQPGLRFSGTLAEGGDAAARALLAEACRAGREGLLAKRADAPYRGTRDASWLKLKCRSRQEFVVAGWAPRSDDARAVGALVLGVHDEAGRLVPAGSVGTGWDTATARALAKRLAPLEVPQTPFPGGAPAPGRWTRRDAGPTRWLKPRTVVEVDFAEWTPEGRLRHPSFVGLRSDKPARAVVRERPMQETAMPAAAPTTARKTARKSAAALPKITHPERVIDEASGATKLDLVRWYDAVAELMLPHLKQRPVAFVRGPGGVGAPLFFQKHAERNEIPGVRELPAAVWPGHEPLLEVASREGLLGAAQMNVIEFHTWNARTTSPAKPDRIVFDLDPGEGVTWAQIREGALLVRALLQELGLASWLKTSGGKGLHVVVPIAPRHDTDTVKAFSQAVVRHLEATIPQRFVAKSGPKNRVGRIFVDWLRNGEGATTVAAFSARARPGLGVSMPVAWDDLPSITSGAHWTIATAAEHLARRGADPWGDFAKARQGVAGAMKRLGAGG